VLVPDRLRKAGVLEAVELPEGIRSLSSLEDPRNLWPLSTDSSNPRLDLRALTSSGSASSTSVCVAYRAQAGHLPLQRDSYIHAWCAYWEGDRSFARLFADAVVGPDDEVRKAAIHDLAFTLAETYAPEDVFPQLQSLGSERPEVLDALAASYGRRLQPDRALQVLDEADRIDPVTVLEDRCHRYVNRGRMLRAAKRGLEALELDVKLLRAMKSRDACYARARSLECELSIESAHAARRLLVEEDVAKRCRGYISVGTDRVAALVRAEVMASVVAWPAGSAQPDEWLADAELASNTMSLSEGVEIVVSLVENYVLALHCARVDEVRFGNLWARLTGQGLSHLQRQRLSAVSSHLRLGDQRCKGGG